MYIIFSYVDKRYVGNICYMYEMKTMLGSDGGNI